MAIPNTTPTPNELYNGEMKKMSDTELRVVLVVTRATLGWEIDHETGRRKPEDWISYWQLKEKTGRGYTALSVAIANCIENGWIEVRDNLGNVLDKKNDRIGKKLFYRLGRIFLDKIQTSSESREAKPTSSKSVITESVITESEAYKINNIQNKNLTKPETQSVSEKEVNDLIDLFKEVNPSFKKLFANKTQREAIKRLLKNMGREKLEDAIKCLENVSCEKFAPVITTPLQLEEKLGSLIIFIKKQKGNNNIIAI